MPMIELLSFFIQVPVCLADGLNKLMMWKADERNNGK